jgi:hypothetical protein
MEDATHLYCLKDYSSAILHFASTVKQTENVFYSNSCGLYVFECAPIDR